MNISTQFTSHQFKSSNSRNLFILHLLFNQMTKFVITFISLTIFLFSSSTTSVNINNVTTYNLIQLPVNTTSCVKILHCNFTKLPNETIDQVNWYVNRNIFYSFSLVNHSTSTSNNSTGINIDVNHSNGSHVYWSCSNSWHRANEFEKQVVTCEVKWRYSIEVNSTLDNLFFHANASIILPLNVINAIQSHERTGDNLNSKVKKLPVVKDDSHNKSKSINSKSRKNSHENSISKGFGEFHPPADPHEEEPDEEEGKDGEDEEDDEDETKNGEKNQVDAEEVDDALQRLNHPSRGYPFEQQGNLSKPIETDFGKISYVENEAGCHCFKEEMKATTEKQRIEYGCNCIGPQYNSVPVLPPQLTKLTLERTNITAIGPSTFKSYINMSEINIFDAPNLKTISSDSFKKLHNLRSLWIQQAPSLKKIDPNVFREFHSLKFLYIKQCGLTEVPPVISNGRKNEIIDIVDFESNKLTILKSYSLNIKAGEVLFDNNLIESVQDFAFNGSFIAKLSFRGNNKLTHLADGCFNGIQHLQGLDLSETSITKLPTSGLKNLETLKIVDTPTLKVIPSVYNFNKIKKAQLTYPHHCCAFKFPLTHDQTAEHKLLIEKHIQECEMKRKLENEKKKKIQLTTSTSNQPSDSIVNSDVNPVTVTVASTFTHNHLDSAKRIESIAGKVHLMRKSPHTSYWIVSLLPSWTENLIGKLLGQRNKFRHDFRGKRDVNSPHGKLKKKFDNSTDARQKRRSITELDEYDEVDFFESSGHCDDEDEDGDHAEDVTEEDDDDSNLNYDEEHFFDPKNHTAHMEGGEFGNTFEPMGQHEEFSRKSSGGKTPHLGLWPGQTNHSVILSKTTNSNEPIQMEFICGDFARAEVSINVICSPEPDEFNPCEDVMGNVILRVCVWVVVVAAVLGNLSVMVVLMSSRFKMTVTKFLMCNLAFADFCMGIYLLLIAGIDIKTIGVYFNYANDWQYGLGCQIAGFITVFASELSIFTLTVITLERLYAITCSIHLDQRLKLGLAIKIMFFGWLYAITMGLLPIFGISGYYTTSICLPMAHTKTVDIAYITSLLTINALAFVVICISYGKMYHSIVSQETVQRATINDTKIAKRMALLVFTDFACWAPIAFFGLTAVAGYPLISVTHAKFVLVFFYPLNSCANPYVYAISTKQYQRDFSILISRYGFCKKRALKYKGPSSNTNKLLAATNRPGHGLNMVKTFKGNKNANYNRHHYYHHHHHHHHCHHHHCHPHPHGQSNSTTNKTTLTTLSVNKKRQLPNFVNNDPIATPSSGPVVIGPLGSLSNIAIGGGSIANQQHQGSKSIPIIVNDLPSETCSDGHETTSRPLRSRRSSSQCTNCEGRCNRTSKLSYAGAKLRGIISASEDDLHSLPCSKCVEYSMAADPIALESLESGDSTHEIVKIECVQTSSGSCHHNCYYCRCKVRLKECSKCTSKCTYCKKHSQNSNPNSTAAITNDETTTNCGDSHTSICEGQSSCPARDVTTGDECNSISLGVCSGGSECCSSCCSTSRLKCKLSSSSSTNNKPVARSILDVIWKKSLSSEDDSFARKSAVAALAQSINPSNDSSNYSHSNQCSASNSNVNQLNHHHHHHHPNGATGGNPGSSHGFQQKIFKFNTNNHQQSSELSGKSTTVLTSLSTSLVDHNTPNISRRGTPSLCDAIGPASNSPLPSTSIDRNTSSSHSHCDHGHRQGSSSASTGPSGSKSSSNLTKSRTISSGNIHKSHKNCTSFVREVSTGSSSGDKCSSSANTSSNSAGDAASTTANQLSHSVSGTNILTTANSATDSSDQSKTAYNFNPKKHSSFNNLSSNSTSMCGKVNSKSVNISNTQTFNSIAESKL